jgi:hypothetical protein
MAAPRKRFPDRVLQESLHSRATQESGAPEDSLNLFFDDRPGQALIGSDSP